MEEDHRGKLPFSSQRVKSTCYQLTTVGVDGRHIVVWGSHLAYMWFGCNIMIARMTCLMTCQISVVHLLQVPQKNAIPRLFRMSILEIRIDAFPLPVTSTQDKIPSLDSKVMCMWLWMRFQSHSCITENLNCLKYINLKDPTSHSQNSIC